MGGRDEGEGNPQSVIPLQQLQVTPINLLHQTGVYMEWRSVNSGHPGNGARLYFFFFLPEMNWKERTLCKSG